jgi:hypothetical protein
MKTGSHGDSRLGILRSPRFAVQWIAGDLRGRNKAKIAIEDTLAGYCRSRENAGG